MTTGVAAEIGEDGEPLLPHRAGALAGGDQVLLGLLEPGARGVAAPGERLEAVEDALVIGDFLLGFPELQPRAVPGRAQRADFVAHHRELRVGLGERDAERLGIDREDRVARPDEGVLVHEDFGDPAPDFGADLDQIGLHIGVLGRHIAPGSDPVMRAHQNDRARHHDEQEYAKQSAPHRAGSFPCPGCRRTVCPGPVPGIVRLLTFFVPGKAQCGEGGRSALRLHGPRVVVCRPRGRIIGPGRNYREAEREPAHPEAA